MEQENRPKIKKLISSYKGKLFIQDKLFNCYVHQQKFNQYALEVHFAFKHTNFQNDNPNKCDIYDNCIENNINFSQHIKNVHDIQM